ncbi:MAG TPA: hypothetical protein VK737_09810 [Opitutales bacterium]|jgi:hypothetical protein|nr:hypothetical protein [Opitutales bacterium]
MWSPLTSSDVLACLAASQITTLRQGALAPGQADPLPALIADVTARVRAEIRGGRRNRVERDCTLLPPELKLAAAHLTLESLQTRLPGLALSADQIRLAADARTLLARVAHGEVPITVPAQPESDLEANAQFGLEVLSHRRQRVTGRNLAGF